MYAIIEAGIELDRYPSREDAEQGITALLLAGRWDDRVATLSDLAVWIERVAL